MTPVNKQLVDRHETRRTMQPEENSSEGKQTPDSSSGDATERTERQQNIKRQQDYVLDPVSGDLQAIEEQRLKAFAHLLDSAIRLPGGFRIGLDGIVGLIPGVGDAIGAALSGYLIYAAAQLDIPRSVIVRMILNALIEAIVGLVPFFGDIFDFAFRSNNRNIKLLREALETRDSQRKQDNADQLGSD